MDSVRTTLKDRDGGRGGAEHHLSSEAHLMPQGEWSGRRAFPSTGTRLACPTYRTKAKGAGNPGEEESELSSKSQAQTRPCRALKPRSGIGAWFRGSASSSDPPGTKPTAEKSADTPRPRLMPRPGEGLRGVTTERAGESAKIPAAGSRAKRLRRQGHACLTSEMYNTRLFRVLAAKGRFL